MTLGVRKLIVLLGFSTLCGNLSNAITITVSDENGMQLTSAMVTQFFQNPELIDTSDQGFQRPNISTFRSPEVTGFTDQKGRISFSQQTVPTQFRFRKVNYKDLLVKATPDLKTLTVKMILETDVFELASAKPSNVWLAAIDVGSTQDKKSFKVECGFCHQQASVLMRVERSPEGWKKAIHQMIRNGSRLPSDVQKLIPQKLSDGFRLLRENPKLLGESSPWSSALSNISITEWPIGTAMSQMYDVLVAKNKLVYVTDNVQDRLYEVDPKNNTVAVYKIPHAKEDTNGGLLSSLMQVYPSHDSASNAHSLAQSKKDGHIFITPSAQRGLVEFDPSSKTFQMHKFKDGFFPNTIRIDENDSVWFTLMLSDQIVKYDRSVDQFTSYDLPARTTLERFITKNIGYIFKVMSWGIPLSNWLHIDREAIGTPFLYGIDIAPNGLVWFSRMHANEIGSLDPATGKVTMIRTPFDSPRGLRVDDQANVWVTSFAESKIAKYSPKNAHFSEYELPVSPKGSETPYALSVDKKRNVIWVTGNQSDSLYAFDVKNERWIAIPFPRHVTYTRGVDIDEDGVLYTSSSNYPSWRIEGSQPTLIRIKNFRF